MLVYISGPPSFKLLSTLVPNTLQSPCPTATIKPVETAYSPTTMQSQADAHSSYQTDHIKFTIPVIKVNGKNVEGGSVTEECVPFTLSTVPEKCTVLTRDIASVTIILHYPTRSLLLVTVAGHLRKVSRHIASSRR